MLVESLLSMSRLHSSATRMVCMNFLAWLPSPFRRPNRLKQDRRCLPSSSSMMPLCLLKRTLLSVREGMST